MVLPFVIAKEFDPRGNKSKEFTFKDYIQKFKPSEVWSNIEENNINKGLNKTIRDEFTTMFRRIDATDELLNLTVRNGNPKMVLNKDGRRWEPPGDIGYSYHDPYSVRRRFLELMKQAIYQVRSCMEYCSHLWDGSAIYQLDVLDSVDRRARRLIGYETLAKINLQSLEHRRKIACLSARNKMIVMQNMRNKYNKDPLYRMGFLFSKTDTLSGIFGSFAYKAFKTCTMMRQLSIKSYTLSDSLEANERLLDLWLDIELLSDLIMENDRRFKEVYKKVKTGLKEAWKYLD